MGGTKFIVLQLKDIIKTAIFAIIGLVLIVLLVILFLPSEKPIDQSSLFIPGTYASEIMLQDSPLNVEVTVSDNEILTVELKNMQQSQELIYPLLAPVMENLASEIISKQSVQITPSKEYLYTESLLIGAVNTALNQARQAQ